ncbi:hypothetical protein [Blastococcus sp. URHD0036]|uniref:hypothetical protein n=1 Tax=Blastococcus sp. URHD0036 TaxID=1380356 RepID=UPI000495CB9B|nr:hypothetical protein [Blastococcus sp. URHD0036]
MTRLRRLLAVVAAGVAVAAAGTAVLTAPTPALAPQLEEAADPSQFRPGNIISDQLFFDGNAMSAAAVQTFLNQKNPNCRPAADGTPCLKNARQTTYTRPADAYCRGAYVGAPDETAATIIAKAGQACGISQRVLLVLLQKEQGLVTLSGNDLNGTRYQKATGYACPDTAPCDSAYFGMYNQVYMAAWRYKWYAGNPGYLGRRVGATVQIRYDTEPECGSSPVFLENQATAGLYNYTPYQPNAASLSSYPRTGDGCSSYGNRNFWFQYTDWFGSTQVPGASEVTGRYAQTGGETGPLGATRGNVICGLRNGGCLQSYAQGVIYWSQGTGARIVWYGAVRDKWGTGYWEAGQMGYPVGDGLCGLAGGGCFQAFEGGSIYWSPATGPHVVASAIRDKWGSLNYEFGALGYPVSDQTTTPNGAAQYAHFQRGSIYWSQATGPHVLSGPVYDRWAASGWENSPLGLPRTDVGTTPDGRGTFAHFQNGSIYRTEITGARILMSPVVTSWGGTGWENGPLGYPVSDQTSTPNGAAQYVHFERGSIYWSQATGAHVLSGPVYDRWAASGWENSPLGLPVTDVRATPDGRGTFAHFQNGSIYRTASTGARILMSPIVAKWGAMGWENGALGYPVADQAGVDGAGQAVQFERGSVYWSQATGAHRLAGPVLSAWSIGGGAGGPMGLPTSDVGRTPDGLADYGHFQRGSIYVTASGTFPLPSAVAAAWGRTGWEHGPLGYPATVGGGAAAEPLPAGATVQPFQGGAVYAASSTAAHAVPADLLAAYRAAGGATGVLGLPTTDSGRTPDGVASYQHFAGGSIYATAATGARVLPTVFRDAWAGSGWERGPLGYPVSGVSTTPDGLGQYVHFQGGSVYWTRATGAHVLAGPVLDAWARGGWETGPLGYPTTDVTATPDGQGRYAYFQGGAIYSSPAGGARVLRGAVLDAWAGTGWEQGRLGYPTGDLQTVPGGTRQSFQRGSITVSGDTGTASVQYS